MQNARATAQRLAAYGRYGDTMLLHVNPLEVAGIASLIPGGLTINPQTGLPEAFLFLPLLASLFGSGAAATAAAAPALAAATTAAAAPLAAATAAPALTAALAPATLAPTATTAGMTGLLGGIKSGISSLLGTSTAAAAPAAVAPVAAAVPATGAAALAPGSAGMYTAAAAPAVAKAVPLIPGVGEYTAATALPATTTAIPLARPELAAATTGGGGGLGSLFSSSNLMPAMMLAQGLSGLLQGGGDDDEDKAKPGAGKEQYSEGDVQADFATDIPTIGHVDRGEHDFFPKAGWMRHYADGGIVSLANGGDIQAQMPQDMSMPLNGVPNGQQGVGDIPESSFPADQIGSPYTGSDETVETPTSNDKELIAAAVAAIQGKMPNAEQIILAFINEFGEDAFKDLVGRVKGLGQSVPDQGGGRLMSGPGDGRSDSISAMINGPGGQTQQAALSDGEYVVPAKAVSALGNGSTNAGARKLDQMVQAANGGLIRG